MISPYVAISKFITQVQTKAKKIVANFEGLYHDDEIFVEINNSHQ